MEKIFESIKLEREEQDVKWGGPVHDDTHTLNDWVSHIIEHLGKSIIRPYSYHTFKYQMVRVAALAVAAIQWADRLNEKRNNAERQD